MPGAFEPDVTVDMLTQLAEMLAQAKDGVAPVTCGYSPSFVLMQASAARQLIAERDDADRRAGAAERRAAHLAENLAAKQEWERRAKKQAGYPDQVSFDEVWKDALAALLEKREADRKTA